MSIEKHLEVLTTAVAALTAATQQLTQVMTTASVSLPMPSASSTVPAAPALPAVPTFFTPQPQFAPQLQAPVAVAAGMPPAPFAAAPAAAPAFAPQPQAPVAVPFHDLPSLIQYAGSVYVALEQRQPGSGARINDVLTQVGVPNANINEAQPHHFAGLYAGLEALKNG